MGYAVKEIFYSLQGEGRNVGRPAVFCRFAGCNLWSGRDRDRATAACNFCDTDFVGVDGEGGGRFSDTPALARAIVKMWGGEGGGKRFVVLTGGEPLLQVGDELVSTLHERGFEIAVETNGSLAAPGGIDWITVSPKGATKLAQISGDELKLVFPQAEVDPEAFEHLAFDHFFLQPLDGPEAEANTVAAIDYCLRHPRWRLSLQTHKFVGIR
jgi:7-carboxy-7-deazaguanine synthase